MNVFLNHRQRMFVLAYVTGWNGAQAAVAAGYAPSWAKQQAHRLLKRPAIRSVVENEKQRQLDRGIIELDKLVALAVAALDFDAGQLFDGAGNLRPLNELSEAARELIVGFESETRDEQEGTRTILNSVRIADRAAAARFLARFLPSISASRHVHR